MAVVAAMYCRLCCSPCLVNRPRSWATNTGVMVPPSALCTPRSVGASAALSFDAGIKVKSKRPAMARMTQVERRFIGTSCGNECSESKRAGCFLSSGCGDTNLAGAELIFSRTPDRGEKHGEDGKAVNQVGCKAKGAQKNCRLRRPAFRRFDLLRREAVGAKSVSH